MTTPGEVRRQIDEVLNRLPAEHVVAGQGSARFVAGPNGAFVLLPVVDDMPATARELHRLATITREAMCEHLTLVPFLTTIAVDEAPASVRQPVTVVALDLLADVLTQGPRLIDTATLATIRVASRNATLDGWRVGVPAGQSIDLRPPRTSTTAS